MHHRGSQTEAFVRDFGRGTDAAVRFHIFQLA